MVEKITKNTNVGDLKSTLLEVAILILMEDALRQLADIMIRVMDLAVAILILMEDALRPSSLKKWEVVLATVAILILMEDALRH